ncbi:Na+/H+ antiporter subunit E [Parvularcula lutaonensis]|uniref:Na+/H+ antiporter subunit E n=1 Tax=Parvularcula lutaonensis TaxID=491923 RepID=A0ABV7MHP4_9PROT|nr:Na+/H+ antiporter subunit E [Parvularcula lutaonensis]GGY54810.1 cation transporter [Parvularcula lutaonensis]
MLSFLKISGRRLVLMLALAALWLLLSGYWNKATLVGFGAFSVAVTLWFADRAETIDREGVPTSVFPRIISYMAWLILEIGKANVMVVREVVRPQIRLAPKLIRVPATQPSDLTKTIFANSVTLTPGTVTVDVREDCLLIHALDESFADIDGISAMGAKVSRLEAGKGS